LILQLVEGVFGIGPIAIELGEREDCARLEKVDAFTL
jgi:hypothetical protein